MSPFEEARESWVDTMNMFLTESMRIDKESVLDLERTFLKAHRELYEGFIGLIDKRLARIDEMGRRKAPEKVVVK